MRQRSTVRTGVLVGTGRMPRTRRSDRRWHPLWLLLAVGIALGGSAVWTNALGAGDRFEGVVGRIALALDPPPNRPTRKTITVTPAPVLGAATAEPSESSEPSASDAPATAPAASRRPTSAPSAKPSPTRPPPVRKKVDVNIVSAPEKVFASQLTKDWCSPAGVQIALAVLGLGDTGDRRQNELAGRIDEWESWEDSHNGGWGPAAMSEALAAYGAGGYEIHAYETRADALRGSAIAINETRAPVILLTWRGAHTWVMTGYRADADPSIFPDAKVSGTYILDPWYPRVSNIWGPSDPPGTFQDKAEMERNFLPWARPEGNYPDRDGKFIVLVPTVRAAPGG